nr:MAG TPA: hypothetical protein [Caudoviricetes sp.]
MTIRQFTIEVSFTKLLTVISIVNRKLSNRKFYKSFKTRKTHE